MPLKESDILNLPDAPDFISEPPAMTMEQMLALDEKMLPFWNKERIKNAPPEFVGEAFKLLA